MTRSRFLAAKKPGKRPLSQRGCTPACGFAGSCPRLICPRLIFRRKKQGGAAKARFSRAWRGLSPAASKRAAAHARNVAFPEASRQIHRHLEEIVVLLFAILDLDPIFIGIGEIDFAQFDVLAL